MQPQIVQVAGQWGTWSWSEGFQPAIRQRSLEEEARRCPEAVINRLIREERWEEAERIMDRYLCS